MKCPKCSAQNMPGTIRCFQCGASMAGDESESDLHIAEFYPDKKQIKGSRIEERHNMTARFWRDKTAPVSQTIRFAFRILTARHGAPLVLASLVPGLPLLLIRQYVSGMIALAVGLSMMIFFFADYLDPNRYFILYPIILLSFSSLVYSLWIVTASDATMKKRRFRRIFASVAFLCSLYFCGYYFIGERYVRTLIIPANWTRYEFEKFSFGKTMPLGSVVWFNPRAYQENEPRQGDVIAFICPRIRVRGNDRFRGPFIERVLATAGDKVEIRDGAIYVNDVVLSEKMMPLTDFAPVKSDSRSQTVGENSVLIWFVPKWRRLIRKSLGFQQIRLHEIHGKAFMQTRPREFRRRF